MPTLLKDKWYKLNDGHNDWIIKYRKTTLECKYPYDDAEYESEVFIHYSERIEIRNNVYNRIAEASYVDGAFMKRMILVPEVEMRIILLSETFGI